MAGNKRWSKNEIDILSSEYGITPLDQLSEKLERSIDSIQWKASSLNIEFSKNNDALIKLNCIEGRLVKIESLIEFIISNISKIAHKHSRAYTESEKDYIIKKQNEISLMEIADNLGRSYHSVYSYYTRLRKQGFISVKNNRITKNALTIEEKSLALEKYKNETNIKKLARELDIDYQATLRFLKNHKK